MKVVKPGDKETEVPVGKDKRSLTNGIVSLCLYSQQPPDSSGELNTHIYNQNHRKQSTCLFTGTQICIAVGLEGAQKRSGVAPGVASSPRPVSERSEPNILSPFPPSSGDPRALQATSPQ